MASVNIATQSWSTNRSNMNVGVNSSRIEWVWYTTECICYAKAWVNIDASKYNSVTLRYSNVSHTDNSDITFGVFDNTSANNSSGKTRLLDLYSSGSATISLSGVTGTKYVGFFIWGNTWNYCDAGGGMNIVSIDAELSGYTLTYDANGGYGAPSSVSDITSTTISSTVPTRAGYDFLGWSTSSTATSASYVAGDSISLSANATLYAIWKKKTYTVTYNANGGSGAPSSQTKTYGVALTLSSIKPVKSNSSVGSYTVTLNANGGDCSYDSISATRTTTYTFSKWNTDSSGAGTSYSPGASYAANADVTLYAIYTSSIITSSIALPTPTRDGYEFIGWTTSITATSGMTGDYTPTKNITLYAIWKPIGLVYICNDTREFEKHKVLICDGSGWNQYVPYIYTETGWEIYSG